MANVDMSYRSVMDLLKYKRNNDFSSVQAMRDCFTVFDLVFRTYRAAIAECGPDEGDVFIGREWLEIIDRLNRRLFRALHEMPTPQQTQEVKSEKI